MRALIATRVQIRVAVKKTEEDAKKRAAKRIEEQQEQERLNVETAADGQLTPEQKATEERGRIALAAAEEERLSEQAKLAAEVAVDLIVTNAQLGPLVEEIQSNDDVALRDEDDSSPDDGVPKVGRKVSKKTEVRVGHGIFIDESKRDRTLSYTIASDEIWYPS